MPRVKVKRQSTFIDMTAMSDVTVLLLTFFMLTSTFMKKEPVQVLTPSSVSEIKVPEVDVMTIIVEPSGQVFMSLDKYEDKMRLLEKVGESYNITFTQQELNTFASSASFGVPIEYMKDFLNLSTEQQDEQITALKGIPTDSTNNQFAVWVKNARLVMRDDASVAIKADALTPYSTIKGVLNTLMDQNILRYNLITSLKTGAEMPTEN